MNYKVGQVLLQSEAAYYKMGQLLQSKAAQSTWLQIIYPWEFLKS